MQNTDTIFSVNQSRIILNRTPITECPVEAFVLSANNRLVLHGATGMAGWVDQQCPDLHYFCQNMRKLKEIFPGRGIMPGDGIVTEGPMNMKIIHAVSVDYDSQKFSGEPYAGIDTVTAATLFSVQIATENGFRSIAISPMCTRGHANKTIPQNWANTILPSVQLLTIWGKLLTHTSTNTLKEVYFCIPSSNDSGKSDIQYKSAINTLQNLSLENRVEH